MNIVLFKMVEKIYLDTNIYLDYFEGGQDKLRPLGHFAYELIRRSMNGEFKIIISDWVIEEFEKIADFNKINELLLKLKETNPVVLVKHRKKDKEKAKKYKNRADALHAILAIKAGADYLVTRNIKDFSEFQNFVKIVLPENI